MASSSAKALPVVSLACLGLGLLLVSMASSSAKALPVDLIGCSPDEADAFQWPPHRPRHCRSAFMVYLKKELEFQWPPHRPRHCRPGKVADAACGWSNGFNGLLIGQGTAGPALPVVAARLPLFQWPPHRPRHCRGQLVADCKERNGGFNGLLIGQGTAGRQYARDASPVVSMASLSAKALPVALTARSAAESAEFQWPPHRPRHCRLRLSSSVTPRSMSFNGLLIGQGTAGRER